MPKRPVPRQARLHRVSNDCPCLNNSNVFFAGFSEVRHVVDAVLESLECTDEGATMYDNLGECSTANRHLRHHYHWLARGHKGMRDSLCREAIYSQRPYVAQCQAPGYSLRVSYEWKSFQASARDLVHRERVLAAAAGGGRVLVVLSGGLHDFTSFRAITEKQRDAMPASVRWPQEWIDHYVDGTMALFNLYRRDNLPDNVCVVYRGANVAARSASVARADDSSFSMNAGLSFERDERSYYHPGAAGGLSDWLNKIAFALAPRYGIPIIDQTPITVRHTPHAGDVYHGYADGVLANDLFRQACAACAGFPPTCSLPIPASAGAPPCYMGAAPPCTGDETLRQALDLPDSRNLPTWDSTNPRASLARLTSGLKQSKAVRSPYRTRDRNSIPALNITALTVFKGWLMNVSEPWRDGRPAGYKSKYTCPLPCVGPHVPGYTKMGTLPN